MILPYNFRVQTDENERREAHRLTMQRWRRLRGVEPRQFKNRKPDELVPMSRIEARRFKQLKSRSVELRKVASSRKREEREKREAELLDKVERLMIRGFTSEVPKAISKAEIVRASGLRNKWKAYRLIDKVHEKWAAAPSPGKLARSRGMAIDNLNHILQEAWARYDNTSDLHDAVRLLQLVLRTTKNLAGLYGLSPKVIARLNNPPGPSFAAFAMMKQQDNLVAVSKRMHFPRSASCCQETGKHA